MNIQIPISQNGITTLATAGKYCDRNIDVKVNVPLEVHRVVVENESNPNVATAQWWLRDNDFVKTHYADPDFCVQVISLQAHTEGYAVSYGYHGNREVMAGVMGFQLNRTASGGNNVQTVAADCVDGSNYNGIPYVKPEGAVVSIHKGGNTTLKPGAYLVVLSVNKEEENV